MHLRRLVGGRESKGRCHMAKVTRAIFVAVLLAVAMLSTTGVASADGGKGQRANITWENSAPGGAERTSNVTWE